LERTSAMRSSTLRTMMHLSLLHAGPDMMYLCAMFTIYVKSYQASSNAPSSASSDNHRQNGADGKPTQLS
jgi:hypothetical protein